MHNALCLFSRSHRFAQQALLVQEHLVLVWVYASFVELRPIQQQDVIWTITTQAGSKHVSGNRTSTSGFVKQIMNLALWVDTSLAAERFLDSVDVNEAAL